MAFAPTTLDDVNAALQFIDCNDRAKWLNAANAIKTEFGDGGRDTWLDWSQGYPKFKQADALAVWKSAQIGKVPIEWIFKEAIANGYKPKVVEYTAEEKQRFKKEQAERQKKVALQQAEEDKRLKALQDRVADIACFIWRNLQAANADDSDYLTRKQVPALGLRVVRYGVIVITNSDAGTVELVRGSDKIKAFYATNPFTDKPDHISIHHYKPGYLVVPMTSTAGELRNLQFITPKGAKLFMSSGQKQGTFYLLGEHIPPAPLCIAEGFATGATIHLATGWAVAIVWDAYNLKAIAPRLKALFEESQFLFCGDDDVDTKGNPGRTYAEDAAGLVGGKTVFPAFLEAG